MRQLKKGDRSRITCKGNRVLVKTIYVDVHFVIAIDPIKKELYFTHWQLPKKEDTRFTKYQRHWRGGYGLPELIRFLVQALTGGKEVYIPRVEQAQELCNRIQDQLDIYGLKDEVVLGRIKFSLAQTLALLSSARRAEFKMAKTQLTRCIEIRDSLGRLNVSVLKTRLATVDARLLNNLEKYFGWIPKYAGGLEFLLQLQLQIKGTLGNIERSLSAITKHEAFRKGYTNPKQIMGLVAVSDRLLIEFKTLAELQPFVRWARHCIKERKKARQYIEVQEFGPAEEILLRVLEAIKLKHIQFELDELIQNIGLGKIRKSISISDWEKAIDNLRDKVEEIDENGFVIPVCREVGNRLTQAQLALPNIDQTKEKLKEASNLI